MHVGDPVPQAVGHHLNHARMTDVQRIARARVVDVVARLIGHQSVIRGVVDALERQRRSALVPFGRVVVDDVENHLEARVVQTRDHLLEFLQAARAVGGVSRIGREEPDAVVAPVIGQPALDEVAVVDERVDRQQLDRGDAERLDVVGHLFRGQPRERSALMLADRRVSFRVAAYVRLVDDRPLPRDARPPRLLLPVEIGIDDDRLRHEGRAVALIERQIVAFGANRVPEAGRIPFQLADVRAGVRIEQQLVGIEPMALLRRVRSVDPVAVNRSGPDVRHPAVPDLVRVLRQLDALGLAIAASIEEADLDFGRVGREEGEVDAFAVPGRAAWMRKPLTNTRSRCHARTPSKRNATRTAGRSTIRSRPTSTRP